MVMVECEALNKELISTPSMPKEQQKRVWLFKWECYAYKFVYLNTWPLHGRTVWERLGSMAFLGKICHWGEL